MKLLEERIKNWAVVELNKTGVNFGSENDIKNVIVADALHTMGSKSGGDGNARPDANYMMNVQGRDIPVFLEYKWGLNKLVKSTKSGIDASTKAIVNYADNGAVYYARHTLGEKPDDFSEAIAVGIAGEIDDNDSNVAVHVYYVYSDKESVMPKLIGEYKDLSVLNLNNQTALLDAGRLTEADKAKALKLSLDTLSKNAKKLNKLMNNRSISVEQRVIYTSGMLLAMQNYKWIKGLVPSDLQGINGTRRSDGTQIYGQIKDYLDAKQIPADKVRMMMSSFAVIQNDVDRDHKDPETGITINKEIFDFIYRNVYTLIDQNSALDILGELYSEFLKYALGDGKENGIVLTPPYVTRLMNQLIGTDKDSYVLDLATGSAGFLVSAMETMVSDAKDKIVDKDDLAIAIADIKQRHMLGVELDMKMYTLATTNMILRGDGATNIVKGSAFAWDGNYEYDKTVPYPANKLLLNPPFSYKENGMPFLTLGLNKLAIGGKGAIIIQDSAGSGKAKNAIAEILKTNQLVASIKMPDDLFQPSAGVPTSIYVLEHTGKPHDYMQNVKFINFKNDGYKRTGRGTKEIDSPHERYEDIIKIFKYGKNALASLKADWDLDAVYFEDVIEEGNFADWNFSAHEVIDTTPTEQDFMDTVSSYLSWQVSEVLKGTIA